MKPFLLVGLLLFSKVVIAEVRVDFVDFECSFCMEYAMEEKELKSHHKIIPLPLNRDASEFEFLYLSLSEVFPEKELLLRKALFRAKRLGITGDGLIEWLVLFEPSFDWRGFFTQDARIFGAKRLAKGVKLFQSVIDKEPSNSLTFPYLVTYSNEGKILNFVNGDQSWK